MVIQPYPTGGGQLRGLFQYLMDFGFQDFILPALLIFTVIFAVLQKIALFKTKKMKYDAQNKKWIVDPAGGEVADRRINSVLSIVIALIVVIPHTVGIYHPDRDPIILIGKFLPQTAVMVAALFMVVLLFGLAGAQLGSATQLLLASVAAVFLCILFLMNIFPNFLPWFGFLRDPAIQALIIVLLTMGLIAWFVIRPAGGEAMPSKLKRWVLERTPPHERSS